MSQQPGLIPIQPGDLVVNSWWTTDEGMETISRRLTRLMRWEDENKHWMSKDYILKSLGFNHGGPTMKELEFMLSNYTQRYIQSEHGEHYRLNTARRHAPHRDGDDRRGRRHHDAFSSSSDSNRVAGKGGS